MCQLLGMNSYKPASVQFALQGFMRRGGDTDHHADGWGIAHFEDGQCQLTVDVAPAAFSPLAQAVTRRNIKARNVIVHVRRATQGSVAYENCHPFVRELWGQTWAFAHNGDLCDLPPASTLHYRPVGQTDSERALCMLLDGLRDRLGEQPPSLARLQAELQRLSARIAAHGAFNYLLSNGELLVAHGSTDLFQLCREAPFGAARLVDCDLSVDFARLNHLDDRIAIVATQPLTVDEDWRAIPPGELRLFIGGREVSDAAPEREFAFAC